MTGATGVVGQALLKKLAAHDVVCLTHRASLTDNRARVVQGDILSPCLGLPQRVYEELAGAVDCVVHAAAITNFSQEEETLFRANVEGTRNVLDLVLKAGVPLYHVSTAFVALCEPSQPGARPNAYARSKARAEEAVRESGVQAVIVRPSRIIGDSRTGAISRFQGFHLLWDFQVRGELSYTSAPPDALVDFVPQDTVVNVLAALIDNDVTSGEYWLTAGERALTLERTIELSRQHLYRLTGRAIDKPEAIDPAYFDDVLKPALLAATTPELLPVLDGVLQMMESLNLQPFASSLTELAQRLNIPDMPDPEATLVRNMQYWARKRGLMKATSFVASD